MSPLLVSSFEGNSEICELLLENAADPDLADQMGRTPLWAASTSGHANVVKLLLFWGCGIDCMDSEGRTVLVSPKNSLKKNKNVNFQFKFSRALRQLKEIWKLCGSCWIVVWTKLTETMPVGHLYITPLLKVMLIFVFRLVDKFLVSVNFK